MLRGVLLAGLAFASAAAAQPAAPARRVVSLNPSLTAMLLALGARDALVGVDDYSERSQPGLAGLPRVGGLSNPNLESVAALRPDLVALVPSVEQRDFRAQLREMGLPVLELDPKSFEDVLAAILALGEAVGRHAEAERRVVEIRRVRAEVEVAVRGLARPRTVLVLQREPLFIVGRGSFIDEMLAVAGARNLGAEVAERYPRVSLEWLVSSAPEVLLDASDDPTPAARHWAQWPSLPAVRDGRVVALGAGEVTLPGPWLDHALRQLARALHGDALAGSTP